MVRIDMESTGGLGGTTEEVFGPLVSNQEPHDATAHVGLLWQTAAVQVVTLCTDDMATTDDAGGSSGASASAATCDTAKLPCVCIS
jgi:hypothetical protein